MRLYNEKEIGEILRRTAELSKKVRRDNVDGLSLEELKVLAEEAGLDPNLVIQAAAEVTQNQTHPEKADLFGGPLTYSAHLNLNVEVDDELWEQMLPSIREHFNDPGVVQIRSNVFEWTGSGNKLEAPSTHVSVQKKQGANQLHVIWSENASAIPFYIPTLVGFILSGVFIFEEFALGLLGIPVWIAVTSLLFLLCRFGVLTFRKSKLRKIRALEKKLTQMAQYVRRSSDEPRLVSDGSRDRITAAADTENERKAIDQLDKIQSHGPELDLPVDEFETSDRPSRTTRQKE